MKQKENESVMERKRNEIGTESELKGTGTELNGTGTNGNRTDEYGNRKEM